MLPNFNTVTLNAALRAAAPPAEEIRYGIYCRFSPDDRLLSAEETRSYVGITRLGTMVAVRFSPERQPETFILPLLAVKDIRILPTFRRYLIHITFHMNRIRTGYTILASHSPHGTALPYQPENLEGLVGMLRKLV